MEKEFKFNFEVIDGVEKLQDEDQKLFNLAMDARQKAYAPYSEFLVGCAVLLENGEIISGNNQENAAYPSGLCAERTAIFWASANFPKVGIKKIFVIGAPKEAVSTVAIPPCGACRQAILEYESQQNSPIEINFSSLQGEIIKTKSIRDLLPFSFDASYLA